ncbi:membrane protein BRI3-like [Watersipora subatra]|uniref:membrane protein BRI3-like n=1 Tax=Watersipora subatra TaxID=2589382 RepID=UPI00355B507F
MSTGSQPSAPPMVYDYDQDDRPPQYEALQKNAGPQTNYGALPGPVYNPPPGVITVQPATNPRVILVGGCPACRIGVLQDDYTVAGVLCAIIFFPIGILCCLALKQRRCSNCGAIFG